MALSPNFGFPEPDNTGLVKNGAQDMRALGDAIDVFLNRPFTRNAVLNSSFNVWQRGTSFTYVGGQQYTADRWFIGSGALGRTVSRQSSGLTGFQYSARVQRDSGNTNTSIIKLMQAMETVNSLPYAGKNVSFSFYARAGANYSTASSALSVRLVSGTGIDQNFDTGYTGSVDVILTNVTLTTSWQRFTVTGAVGSTATELGMQFQATPVGTAGANDWFEVTGVQLEVGNQASPYTPAGSSYQAELAMCQRYYQKSYAIDTAPGASFPGGYSVTVVENNIPNTNFYHYQPLIVQTRVAPTVTIYSAAGTLTRVSTNAGSDLAANSAVATSINDNHFSIQNSSGGALTASAGGFIFFYVASAEL
jgi:hypothetical protein